MVVYVDDFKMAGPKEALREAWSLLRKTGPNGTKGLNMDDPKAGNTRYLGCEHKYAKRLLPPHRNFMVDIKEPVPKPPKPKAADDGSGNRSDQRPPIIHENQKKKKFQLIDDLDGCGRIPPQICPGH
jgi:hypothetical protein